MTLFTTERLYGKNSGLPLLISMGGLSPFWEVSPTSLRQVNILGFSLLLLAAEVMLKFLPTKSFATRLLRRPLPFFGINPLPDFSLHMLFPFHNRKRNLTLISVNQVKVYSMHLQLRSQSLSLLSKLLSSPCWNLYSTLFASSPPYVPVTSQHYLIF